jgi:hypothetical protein
MEQLVVALGRAALLVSPGVLAHLRLLAALVVAAVEILASTLGQK